MDTETRKDDKRNLGDTNKYIEDSLSKKDGGHDKVNFDKLLSSAGDLGLYQFLLFLGTFPFYTFGVFVYFSQLFMTEISPNHWCWIPELANLSDIERRDLAIPKDDSERFGYSQCVSYVANWTEILATGSKPNKNWTTTPCQNGWEFNKTEIPYPTISSELGWVCDKRSYQANAQAIFFLGSIFGGLLLGTIADEYGRIPAIVTCNMVGCIGGLASTFSRNFIEFAACRFFMGMAYDNCFTMVYLLIFEYIPPKYKTLISNSSSAIFYSLSETVLPWIALACGHWKTLSLVTSVPLALGMLTPFFFSESPRWLLSKGRIDDTVEKVLMIGRLNKKNIPLKLIREFKKCAIKERIQKSQSCLEMFKRPFIRNILILICLEFMCCTILFDGLMRNVGQLDVDFFLSFSVTASTELPSIMFMAFVLDWTGRRLMTIVCMAIICIFCSLAALVSGGLPMLICIIISRFAINISYNVNLQWAAELLPTSVRASGISYVYICGYIAIVVSPYIIYLNTFIYWLPLAILSGVAGIGTVLPFFIPETVNKDMPQTFEDTEEVAQAHKVWNFPCLSKNNANKHNITGIANDSFEM